MDLYVDRISSPVTNLGPGRRIGLWVQGCTIGCPGCISRNLLVRRERSRMPVRRVADRIVALSPRHDGLTVSGGEPFEQPEALTELLSCVKTATKLDILVYTGYSLEALQVGSRSVRSLLGLIDVLIDGPFRLELPNRKLWRGSDNQRMHLLTPRARKYAMYREAVYDGARELQFEVTDEGMLRVVGIPERGFRREFPEIARRFGISVSKTEDAP
jgi:anaerobic ribonucleoside-triphosphate reductase activating protein